MHQVYTYDAAGYLKKIAYTNGSLSGSVTLTVDNLGRLTGKVVDLNVNSADVFYNSIAYTYTTHNGNQSAQIAQLVSAVGKGSATTSSTTYKYTYDANGNITQIKDANNVIQYQYAYDDLGQLIREDNRPLGCSYTYSYVNGNITSVRKYAFTTGTLGSVLETDSYEYDTDYTEWCDLLYSTQNDGYRIGYDGIGNPIYSGTYSGYYYNGMEYKWEGRQLVELKFFDIFDPDGEVSTEYNGSLTFEYNEDGIRTAKIVNGIRHEYILSGSQILAERIIESDGEITLVYIYDEYGLPIGMKYRTKSYAKGVYDTFYFERNLQGDIVAVYNASGEKTGSYTYDAWGNCTVSVVSGNTTQESTIVRKYNPFRYRGYYLDTETGMYYLQSRYYNPQWRRFINGDGAINANGDIVGFNMFAYCSNNPVMFADPCGTCIHNRDFWNWCDKCKGFFEKVRTGTQEVLNTCQNAIDFCFTEVPEAFAEAYFFDFGIGFGLGGSLEVDKLQITALTRADYFAVRKDVGEKSRPYLAQVTEAYVAVEGVGCILAYGESNTYDMKGNEVSRENLESGFDPTTSVGGSLYLWLIGGTLEVGFDWDYFISKLFIN